MKTLIEEQWCVGEASHLPVHVLTNPFGENGEGSEIVMSFGEEYTLEGAKELAEHIVEAHNLWYQQTQMR